MPAPSPAAVESTPAASVRATPEPTATPTPPPPPTPVPAPLDDLEHPRVRVLLERGDRVVLPQPGRAFRATWESGAAWVWGPLEVTSDTVELWQVAAYADAGAAGASARGLAALLPAGAEVVLAAGEDGLTRVRVRWRDPALAAETLAAAGFPGAYRVPGEGRVRVTAGGGGPVVASEVVLEPVGSWPTAVGGRSYRGRFVARASRGETLLVNELNLESYLRGVVPVEMGPSAFPELEALKAQAVAARTYAVAHLGDHDDEGWDLCDTPACQAYYGSGAEHPLSDRAVAETAGIVAVFGGLPIDAMYTSTCGGHTEDAAVLFPDRAQPYLTGVPCRWERPLALAGIGVDGGWGSLEVHAAALAARALGLDGVAVGPPELLAAAARACGSPALPASPSTADAFARSLLEACGLDGAAGHVGRSPVALDGLLALADLYGIALSPPTGDWRGPWAGAATLAALELAGVVARDEGEAVPRPEGAGIFPRRAERSEALPQPLPLFERWAGAVRGRVRLEVLPGTRLERLRRGDEVIALTAVRSDGGGEADRRSAWREWVREKEWADLERRLGVPDLQRLEVTGRGVSGRVVGLAAVGRSGARREWSGFEIRRVLELPETLFDMVTVRRPDGSSAVRFLGRGWGHGVGLCQNGAYGLARSGRRYDAILAHYYRGAALVTWAPAPPGARPGE